MLLQQQQGFSGATGFTEVAEIDVVVGESRNLSGRIGQEPKSEYKTMNFVAMDKTTGEESHSKVPTAASKSAKISDILNWIGQLNGEF